MPEVKYPETQAEIAAVLETEEWKLAVHRLEVLHRNGNVVHQLRHWQKMADRFGPRLMKALDEWMQD